MPLSLRRRIALEAERIIHKKTIEEHPLKQLFWECTLRCNLHCRHCGSDCKMMEGQKDMPLEDFLKVLDSVKSKQNPHKTFIIITGGEPLMRQDLEDCGKAIWQREFPWGVVTNGYQLSRERFISLRRSGLHTATVSLDGLEEDHNWQRGHQNSFERASEAIRLMVAEANGNQITGGKGTPRTFIFDVVTCVNRRTLKQLPAIRDYLLSLGCRNWRVFTIFPSGRAKKDESLHLTPNELRELMEFIRDTRKSHKAHPESPETINVEYGCEGFMGNYEGDIRSHFFHCHAGVTVGSVLSDGSISACPSIRADFHQGNIYKDDFMEVWQRQFLPYRDHSWLKTGPCKDCEYWRYCQGNGMHVRDKEGHLLQCLVKEMEKN